MTSTADETPIEAYTRTYQEHHARLVAYARTLTGDSWLAEDLTAEAHFRVWRRISAGNRVDHIPGYLAATIRNLAVDLGHAPRELPQGDDLERLQPGREPARAAAPQEGAYAVMLAGALKQLPHRWVRALWLTEVEDWPLEAVGDDLGTNRNATAVLLHRAREGLRQAFLGAQPGAPDALGCAEYWDRMPAHIRGTSSARQDRALRAHADGCPDCRARLALLERANHRLPALVGPALLLAFAGGAARYLVPAAGARAAARSHGVGRARHLARSRHATRASGPTSAPVGPGTLAAAGGLVLAAAGAVAALTLTGSHTPTTQSAAARTTGAAAPASPAQTTDSASASVSGASSASPARSSARTLPVVPARTAPSTPGPTTPTAASSSPAAATAP
ncbi:sigma-70 family RNA polymerase sigma factor, partial [Streptacidiphilus carbonis]|uniref:sigma-70 family RNA polymerase sigma factor n=1 Tax=Streptacidiphilus carbonis TaxID=105422 RepID=UPI00069481AE